MKHLILFLFLLCAVTSKADHLGGGEMFYTHLGNNTYRITFVKRFPCTESSMKTDVKLWIYHNSTLLQEVTALQASETVYQNNVHSPCVSTNQSFCMRKGVFTAEVTLPPASGNYYVTYQRCCLYSPIGNLDVANTNGLTAFCTIPGSFSNSSPVFNSNPPSIFCRNLHHEFDLSATDPDGDQLVYELVAPLNGGTYTNTVPSPAPPPPYSSVQWAVGYDETHQLGLSSTITIDSTTGNLSLFTYNLGYYYVGIRVKEFRNNVQIGEVNRSFLLQVINCTTNFNATSYHIDSACFEGNAFSFGGYLSNPSASVFWDFGPHASVDTSSNLYVPGVSFDTSGTFPITFTASYNGCVQTIHSTVTLIPESTIGFTVDSTLKCAPYTAEFINLSEPNGPVSYQWTFDDGSFSSDINPQFTYTNPGSYNVGLVMTTGGMCPDTLTIQAVDYMVVHPTPVSDFEVNATETGNCERIVYFTDQSSGSTQLTYLFGDNQSSTDPNPEHHYTESGFFHPVQIATNALGCSDTSKAEMFFVDTLTVYIPNSFSPDGNEQNNIFIPVTPEPLQGYELRIYTRWRDLLFVSRDPAVGWDGTYSQQVVPPGTYIYMFDYMDCSGETKTITGHVNVIK